LDFLGDQVWKIFYFFGSDQVVEVWKIFIFLGVTKLKKFGNFLFFFLGGNKFHQVEEVWKFFIFFLGVIKLKKFGNFLFFLGGTSC